MLKFVKKLKTGNLVKVGVGILSLLGMGYARVAAEPKESVAEESKAVEQKPILPMTEEYKLSGDELPKYQFTPRMIGDPPPEFIPDPEEEKARQERIDKIQYHQTGRFKPATLKDYKRLKKESLERKLIIQYGEMERQVDPPQIDDGKGYAQYAIVMTKEKGIPEIVLHPASYIVEESGQIFGLGEIYPLHKILPKELRSQLSPFYNYLSQDELAKLGSLDELLSKVDEHLARLDISCISGKFMFGYMVSPMS